MFQHTWFEKKCYTKNIKLNNNKIKNWVDKSDIDSIGYTNWVEHCLECAEPLCWGNCVNYIKRRDLKCKKTVYGFKCRKDLKDFLFPTQLQFEKWGKIETPIYFGSSRIKKVQRLDKRFRLFDYLALKISNVLRFFSPRYKLCGALNYYKGKFLKKRSENSKIQDDFLFQCYSSAKDKYNIIFEIYSPSALIYKTSCKVEEGFNQKIFSIKQFRDIIDESCRIKVYPENDIKAEIVVLCADFVTLKQQLNADIPAEKVKCVAWDLDNTIWNGTLIESNPDSLSLKDNVLDTITWLDQRGIIQVVVSKNYEESVLPVIKRLGLEKYFVYIVANWGAKSQNLLNIAKELNININTFAFVDDSAFERNEVSTNIPSIRTYKEDEIIAFKDLNEFDIQITEESKLRRQMYITEKARKTLSKEYNGNVTDYLKQCELVVQVTKNSKETSLRSYELIQRTNQLNLSGKKYSKEEFNAITSKNENCFVLFASDKFGGYGQVGFFVLEILNDAVKIIEYAMSCRVAGKCIEQSLLNWIKKEFHKDIIVFEGTNNHKNHLLIETLCDLGFVEKSNDSSKLYLEIDLSKKNFEDIVDLRKI